MKLEINSDDIVIYSDKNWMLKVFVILFLVFACLFLFFVSFVFLIGFDFFNKKLLIFIYTVAFIYGVFMFFKNFTALFNGNIRIKKNGLLEIFNKNNLILKSYDLGVLKYINIKETSIGRSSNISVFIVGEKSKRLIHFLAVNDDREKKIEYAYQWAKPIANALEIPVIEK